MNERRRLARDGARLHAQLEALIAAGEFTPQTRAWKEDREKVAALLGITEHAAMWLLRAWARREQEKARLVPWRGPTAARPFAGTAPHGALWPVVR